MATTPTRRTRMEKKMTSSLSTLLLVSLLFLLSLSCSTTVAFQPQLTTATTTMRRTKLSQLFVNHPIQQPSTSKKQRRPSLLDEESNGDTSWWTTYTTQHHDRRSQMSKTSDDDNNNNEEKVVKDGDDDRAIALGISSFAVLLLGATITAGLSYTHTIDVRNLSEWSTLISSSFSDPAGAISSAIATFSSMDKTESAIAFGIAYTVAEVLAFPSAPLTASAGYLFGPILGTGIVLMSASVAASISYGLGKTLFRSYVEEHVLPNFPRFQTLDAAIERRGFQLMLLLRLSPLFPFALSNYLYGASSISFPAYFWGTLIGFTPGTIAYVCTGSSVNAWTAADGAFPWYVYLIGATVAAGLLKTLADTATSIIQEIEQEEEEERNSKI